MNRRSFLKASSLFTATFATAFFSRSIQAFAETCDKIKPVPQMVSMLSYADVSKTKGENCANCIQFQSDKKATTGKCPIFQNCEVKAKGWCKSWAKKS